MRFLPFLLFALIGACKVFSQTTLSAGDIAILQYNADGATETIKFIALTSMENGTSINFTDNGWRSNNTFRSNEGIDTWTATGNISCGDIITFTFTNVALGVNGDQILAYQGSAATPTFIFAINNEGSAVWQSTASNARTSALPTGLTNGTNAIAITEIDNAMYDSSTLTGTRSAILSAICTNANWGGSNTVVQDFTSTFTSEITWTTSWNGTGNPSDYFTGVIDGDYDTSTDGNFSVCECQINASRTVTVNSGGTITIENGIVNNGDLIINSGGSLVQETSDGLNTGANYTVERISTSQQEEGDYTFWSTPLSSSTLAEVANAQLYFSFNATTQNFVSATSATSMSVGTGYAIIGDTGASYPGTYTASFTGGVPNNGNIDVTLGFSNDADDTNDWNLIGNPYASAIDADTFLNDNSSTIGGTIYFWTHNTEDSAGNNTQDDYAMYNTTGGTAAVSGGVTPDGNIASGQGFFAQAIASSNVSFTNSMRISGNNNSFFRGPTPVKPGLKKDNIWLNLSSESTFNQILIGFLKGATNGPDSKYDGKRFVGNLSANFYSLIKEGVYGIQGKPPIRKEETISLGYDSSFAGSFTISIDHIIGDNLPNSEIILFDKDENIHHNLKDGSYTFYSNIGTFKERFELLINSKIKKPKIKTTDVTAYKNGSDIIISPLSIPNIYVKSVTVHDLYSVYLGSKNHLDVIESETHSISIKRSNSPLLLVEIQLTNGQILKKKILNLY
ncbi:hypothetical protein [Pseudotenacibaculum haliotis]|uniref:Uncharacterized protein n=1 Tax=Pseudotenacibaculum haliotis TaxID=1862138 RepID=A0ABW5LRM0_9FLAO